VDEQVELIGRVVRLQVQQSRLKPGPAATRVYDPSPLLEVEQLMVTPRGCLGRAADGTQITDVHHADHPDTRNNQLRNGLSVMTVSRYRSLRATYGQHLADGIAGESLLLDTEHLEDLSGELALEAVDGLIPAVSEPAPPCVEFSRFVLGRGAGDVGPEVLATMAALGDGARGYYLRPERFGAVRAGAQLLRV
jgi:hypothetical protein